MKASAVEAAAVEAAAVEAAVVEAAVKAEKVFTFFARAPPEAPPEKILDGRRCFGRPARPLLGGPSGHYGLVGCTAARVYPPSSRPLNPMCVSEALVGDVLVIYVMGALLRVGVRVHTFLSVSGPRLHLSALGTRAGPAA